MTYFKLVSKIGNRKVHSVFRARKPASAQAQIKKLAEKKGATVTLRKLANRASATRVVVKLAKKYRMDNLGGLRGARGVVFYKRK